MGAEVDEHDSEPDPQVARWLDQAAPPVTPDDDDLATHMMTMAVAATREQQKASRRKHGVIAAILAPILLVSTAGAAVAASTIDWSSFWGASASAEWTDWAQQPDATINYSLPGGGSCELRLGQFSYSPDPNRPAGITADPRSLEAALDYVHNNDVLVDADIDGTIQENRSDKNEASDDNGNSVPFGYWHRQLQRGCRVQHRRAGGRAGSDYCSPRFARYTVDWTRLSEPTTVHWDNPVSRRSRTEARFTELMIDVGPELLHDFERRVGEIGADLLGELMSTAWRRRSDLPADEEESRMWLFGIARNVLRNNTRSSIRQDRLANTLRDSISNSTAPDPAELFAIRDAVQRLDGDLAEIVTLVHWEGLSIAEAGQLQGIPASTARGRYQRAKEALKEALAEHEYPRRTVR